MQVINKAFVLLTKIGMVETFYYMMGVILLKVIAFLKGYPGNDMSFLCHIHGRKGIFIGKKNKFSRNAVIDLCVSNFFDSSVNLKNSYISIGCGNFFDRDSYLIAQKGYIEIGNNCHIGKGVVLQGLGGVKLHNNVLIGPGAKIFSSNHMFTDDEIGYRAEVGSKVTIHDNVWIGADVKILSGVEVGKNSAIGAGSIVTKSVPPDSIVVGVNRILRKNGELS